MSWFRLLLTVVSLLFSMQRLVRAATGGSSWRCVSLSSVKSRPAFMPCITSLCCHEKSSLASVPISFFDRSTLHSRSWSALASSSSSNEAGADTNDFFASNHDSFESMGVSSPVLLERLKASVGLERPSAVQASAYEVVASGGDVTIGAETGSGKTLAYLLPLLDDVLQRKQQNMDENGYCGYDYARAVILVPNKELVQQVVRMAEKLCGGRRKCLLWGSVSENCEDSVEQENDTVSEKDIVRLAIMPGGLKEPQDFAPFRNSIGLGGKDPPVDIVISTPASSGPFGLKPKHIDLFADIQTLVVDEADMLLDGGYIRALENCLMGFRRADKLDVASSLGATKTQHVFSAATLPDTGLRSVDAYLQRKFPNATRVTMAGMHNARHYGLRDRTVWIEANGKKERMEQLVEMLKTPPSKGLGLQGEKVMVFLNSVDDVEGANNALGRAGIHTVPYHAKIPLSERSANLDKFRRYSPTSKQNEDAVPVLVCTDLASRGLDVPGVSAIVQLQFAGNVVAHLHRMGRCGRAGNRDGRGIIFYGDKEAELVKIVRNAEDEQERMMLEGDVEDLEEAEQERKKGTVKDAFSRKRGFTKKRKKMRKKSQPSPEPAET